MWYFCTEFCHELRQICQFSWSLNGLVILSNLTSQKVVFVAYRKSVVVATIYSSNFAIRTRVSTIVKVNYAKSHSNKLHLLYESVRLGIWPFVSEHTFRHIFYFNCLVLCKRSTNIGEGRWYFPCPSIKEWGSSAFRDGSINMLVGGCSTVHVSGWSIHDDATASGSTGFATFDRM